MLTVSDALWQNGVIIERARRERRSFDRTERSVIAAGRNKAHEAGLTIYEMNRVEMLGERDWDAVLAPVRVVVVFSYYDDPYEDIPANPHYLIRESNHVGLPVGGHVCPDQLQDAGIKVPKTPTFEKWVKAGRKVVRK